MKKRFIALLLCCVMIFTLSPSLIASAAADDETVQQVEQTSEAKDTDQQPEQQPDQAQNEDKNETQATEEPKTEEPKTEEPKTEEPKTEEPKAEEPKAEEPKAEEPKAEEPKAEEETTIPAAEQSGAPVESEIITPTVNFTNVAPFLAPVSGGVRMLRAPLAAAPRAAANFAANDTATDNGMVINKTATANNDGSYTITLEAFAIGSKVITEQKTDIPTDIVLVIDQSGSMEDPIGGYTYPAYREDSGLFDSRNYYNEEYYPLRHNGGSENLWHKLNDNEYVAVSVEQKMDHTPISGWDNGDYYSNQNNLYCLVNGEYKRVNVTSSWGKYEYYVDGSKIGSGMYSWNEPTFDNGYAPLYQFVKKYTYSYTLNGVTTVIKESFGDGSSPDTQFYRRDYSSSAGGTRLNALKNAATTFASAVAAKAAGEDGDITTTADNVNHRIAVVGYADTDWDYGYNTGVFIGSTLKRYENNAAGVYSTALQDMSTTNGKSNVAASLNALQASGATRTDYGLIMAKGILDANPVPTGETRNRVVIVFTDGSPTDSNGFELDVANAAINNANAIKDSGATVYSIGIFSGADASSAGKEPDEDYYDDGIWGRNYTDAEMSAACNWFMQKVSSNNGTPHTPSYYLSAGDNVSLNSIFQQISDQIETGGSSSTLTSEAVVKDIISPQFTLPDGANASSITLETYACKGKDGENYTWSSTSDGNGGAYATVNGDQVSVTGFNFSENWCGTETDAQGNTTVRGKKLVISFKVQPKAGFLGGNDVVTNASAGIYENGSAQTPVMTFEQPQVDVTIKKPDITLPDANVYLGAYFSETVNADDLKAGTSIKFGDNIVLDLTKPDQNWGLEDWQTEYVTIEVKVTDKDGNEVTDFEKLTEDTEYKVSVSIKPKTDKAGNSGYDESMAGTIHVFKPELTFKDSEVWYGDNAPTDFSGNLQEKTWVNGTKKHDDQDVQMLNNEPTLNLTYAPEDGKIADGKVNTKQDIAVDLTVKIGETDVTGHTTFVHTKCADDNTCTDPANGKFWLHIKTCQLNITKQGGTDGEPYVFNIYKVGSTNVYTQVTIVPEGNNNSVTIYELPVGTYTIVEDTGWSWRFTPTIGDGVTLSKDNASGTIACSNRLSKPYWLNGFSTVVKNIYAPASVEQ